ncbi:nuclear transport factor 2 family protein [Rhodococcus sp. NPDC019627]|uniref:nuclear transport factor 2 family protein n=1 Tax=unclassified Rhodococcus (in: high G+C Gram-positive bacteria) TaxID=192944 RepID=UPI0033FE25B5
MSIEQNKQFVEQFLAKFATADIDAVLADMSETCTWWVGGKPELFPLAGTKNKAEMDELLRNLVVPMKNGLEMRVKALTAEGDRVAAEVESYGENPDGSIYNNEYHMLFVVSDGKMQQVKEYLDTQHTFDVFLAGK